MTGREVVKKIVEENGMSNAAFAKRCGVSGAAMWDRLNNIKVKDIPLSLLNDMLRVLDYKILVVPANAKVPAGGYYVDGISAKPKAKQSKTDKSADDNSAIGDDN
jgi:hypothetical protein